MEPTVSLALVPTKRQGSKPLSWWLIATAFAFFVLLRGYVVLTAVPTFSSREDMDKLVSWQEEDNMENRSRLDAVWARLVNSSNVGASAGHRVNLSVCMLSDGILPRNYASIKLLAIVTGGATLAAFLWALRSSVSAQMAVLFSGAFTLAPIRLFVQSGLFIGNHVEMMLFVALSIGFAVHAVEGNRRWQRDASFAGLGLMAGLGLYYCQSTWLWIGSLLPILVFMFALSRRPFNQWLSGVASFGAGLMPGIFIIYTAFWPNEMMMLLPYGRSPDAYQLQFDRLQPECLLRLFEEMMLPFRHFHNPAENFAGVVGGSAWWLAAATVLLFRVRRRGLHIAVWSLLIFVAVYTVTAALTDIAAARHRIPMVASALLLQSLTLCELLPEAISSFFKKGQSQIKRGLAQAGLLVGLALVVPRAHEDLALAGQHALADGLAYDTSVVMTLGLNAMEPKLSQATAPKIAELSTMAASKTECRLILAGMAMVLGAGEEAVDTDFSLPKSLIYGSGRDVMRARTAECLAENRHLDAIEMLLDEQQMPIQADVEEERLYLCGVEMALQAIDEAENPPPPPSTPELSALAAALP